MATNNYLRDEFELRLRSDPALFDFFLAGTLDGVWYWDLEHPENEWMSPGFWKLFGYDPATKKHLASEWQEMINPDDLQLALDNFRKHCDDPSYPYDQVVRYRHRDGSTVWIRCRGFAIRDQNGKPIRLLGAHTDMTQVMRLKADVDQAVESLRASKNEIRSILEHSPDTIARYDRDCRRIYVNRAFGALADGGMVALLGTRPSELPGGTNAEVYETKIREVFATGEDAQFELKWLGKNSKEICSHIRLTAEHDLSGAVITVLGVGRDITELNESRAEIERKELAKTRFLAAAGHDLRQPLAAANLFIDALKFTGLTRDQNEIVQRLDMAMSNFNDLLDALLDVSKLDAGMVKPEFTSISVADIFNWLEQSFGLMAKQKRLALRLVFPYKETPHVYGDISLVKTVLMNQVSNAIKFTAEGGVLVGARRRGGNVLFQIWDTGIGVPEESAGKIFDEFYQVNNPQRDRTQGLGLGLAIAKRALSLLDGKIACRSRSRHGSVFEFSLPLVAPEEVTHVEEARAQHDHGELTAWARGKRFVVVEDDRLVAEALSKSIVAMWGEVECFHSAEDALAHAGIEDADYYIVDYMLSGDWNGIELLNQIRQKSGKSIKAVMMTGETSSDFIRKASLFDWPVVHKPVSISKLISRLCEG